MFCDKWPTNELQFIHLLCRFLSPSNQKIVLMNLVYWLADHHCHASGQQWTSHKVRFLFLGCGLCLEGLDFPYHPHSLTNRPQCVCCSSQDQNELLFPLVVANRRRELALLCMYASVTVLHSSQYVSCLCVRMCENAVMELEHLL